MRLLITVLSIPVSAPLALSISFPQIGVGGGTECIILISNKSQFNWKCDFVVMQGNNEPWEGTLWANNTNLTGLDGFTVELLLLASMKIVLTGGSQLQVGYIEMDPDIDSSVLDVAVSFFYNFHDSQGNHTDSVSVPPSMFSDDEFLLPVERSASVDTGFAWCPWIWEGPFDVVMTLYRENGTIFQTKTITFTGHMTSFFTGVFDNVPWNFVGMMRIKSEYSIHVAALRLEYTADGFQYAGTPPDDFIP